MEKNKVSFDIEKIWPKTKEELEKALEKTKELMHKGEHYMKVFSEKSAKKTKKISLSLKKEQLFYKLGKTCTTIPSKGWHTNEKIASILSQINEIDLQIKTLNK